jgi:hypothetical protein
MVIDTFSAPFAYSQASLAHSPPVAVERAASGPLAGRVSPTSHRMRWVALGAAVALALTGCTPGGRGSGEATGTPTPASPTGIGPPAAALHPDLPVNRWVRVPGVRCEGGKAEYAQGCPSSRGWIQLAADSKRDEVVLFGGSGEWYFNDLWSFDPADRTWTLLEQDARLAGAERDPRAAPKGRDNHQWIYDSQQDKFWLYGGTGGAGLWTWTPEGRKWTLVHAEHDGKTQPMATLDPAFAAAEDLRGALLFGGERYAFSNETWWLDLDRGAWEKLKTNAAPPARAQTENAMVYDPARKQFILFGGRGVDGKPLGDTWIFDVQRKEWREIKAGGPPARDGHVVVFDQKSGKMIAFGGNGLKAADTWVFDPQTERWEELASARGDYEAANSRVVSAVYLSDMDLTVYRDLKGGMYYLRLDGGQPHAAPPAGPVEWQPASR